MHRTVPLAGPPGVVSGQSECALYLHSLGLLPDKRVVKGRQGVLVGRFLEELSRFGRLTLALIGQT